LREAKEEGWSIGPHSLNILHTQYVDCQPVIWFYSNQSARKLDNWKEKGRIQPVAVSFEALLASGYGNEVAMPKARLKLQPPAPYDV